MNNLFSTLFNAKNLSASEEKLKEEIRLDNREADEEELNMMANILRLHRLEAKEIMVPRVDLHWVDIHASINDAARKIVNWGVSRLPVFDGNHENIVGVVHAKALLQVLSEEDKETLDHILLAPYFVPEVKPVNELLSEMRQNKVHFAIVIDEYGGVSGIITLEDIIERIVGNIQDEFDKESAELVRISDNEFMASGRIAITDLNEMTGMNITAADVDTLGGLIFTQLGRIPNNQESVSYGNYLFTIEAISGRKIKKVKIVIKENNHDKTEEE